MSSDGWDWELQLGCMKIHTPPGYKDECVCVPSVQPNKLAPVSGLDIINGFIVLRRSPQTPDFIQSSRNSHRDSTCYR